MPRSQNQPLSRLFASTTMPVYVLDERRTVVYCNTACVAWTGLSAQQLLLLRCDYHTEQQASRESDIAAGLCPPPDVFAGRCMSSSVGFRCADGTVTRRDARFVPLTGNDGIVESVLAVVAAVDSPELIPESDHESPEELHVRLRALRQSIGSHFQIDSLIGNCPESRRLREQVRAAADLKSPIMIVGRPGSGREHLARAIHAARAATNSSLVVVECAIVDGELFRRSLDAVRHVVDAAPDAHGTLLLKEVDRLSSECQVELQRRLDQQGSERIFLIGTATQSLRVLARREEFRLELSCALQVFTIDVVSLEERRSDIRLLAQNFLERRNQTPGKQLAGFSPEAQDMLEAYPWPGELDELRNAVNEAAERALGVVITPAELPEEVQNWGQAVARHHRPAQAIEMDRFLEQIQRELIAQALQRTRRNRTKAAELLGISRARLLRLMGSLGLQTPPDDGEPIFELDEPDAQE